MKTILIAAVMTAALAGAGFAQKPTDTSPEMATSLAGARAYEAAYAKADVKAMADFFTDDAEYTSDDGQYFAGRAQIEETLRSGLMNTKGGKIAIQVEGVRALSPDVVSEKGTTTVTAKSGEANTTRYTAVLVKKDGKWKISQLVESPIPAVTPRERLDELAWLIGDWEDADKTNDLNVRSQFLWARGGNFLARNVTVKRGDQVTLEGWQVIGWDPIEERIRSWTFDSEGGFAEGRWTRDGNHWLQRETGVTPDGDRTSADNTFTKISADRFTWESDNRTLDGDPQPSISRIEINRAKGN